MQEEPAKSIRILFVEDLEVDMERELYQLRRDGLPCTFRRVETARDLSSALREFDPTIVLSDYSLPQFDGMSALRLVRDERPDLPFVFVSGTIGEEVAIAALHAGAIDYVLKDNLARLAPAVRRAIGEAELNAERQRQAEQIARLNRVLRVLSGVNSLVLRIRDRNELLREICRLAVSVGGYAATIAAVKIPGMAKIQPVAWSGLDDKLTRDMCAYVADSAMAESGVIGQVFATGREFVCNNTEESSGTARFDSLMVSANMRTVVVLPLLVDGTSIGVLLLAAGESGAVEEEELAMLREVAGNLSFGLQYLQRDSRARFLSHFDPHTGLAKRPLFCERVDRAVASEKQARHAVVLLNVERLSIINDSFGRHIGDLLLQHVADRLRKHYPQTDQIAYFGGGTFALLRMQSLRSVEEIKAIKERQVPQLFDEPFEIEGQRIPVTVRSGFAVYPDHGSDGTTLVQNAEAALRHGRVTGQRVVEYNAAARSEHVGRLALEHRLRFALERSEFELHYQPKVDAASGRIEGAEALLRWRCPEDGLVTPAVFLPLLESVGLIVPVGEWVVEQAARDLQAWQQAGLPPVRVAVNIATSQLRHPDFEAHFTRAIGTWTSADWGLDIEITEGVLNEDSVAEIGKLSRLRKAGVQVAIDDFGTGYSSLSRLAALPIDTLKIDRSFVRQSVGSASGTSLVKTVIGLARTFGMSTVGEGVETTQEYELLRQLGCDQLQGFLYSAALAPADFVALLRENKGGVARLAAHHEAAAGLQRR
jgi:diguanylate cyclase (GGDEF)-like protein